MTPFGEHFDLGIKDLVPMAVTEAVASVDKGFDRADIEAAWFGELTTTDGFPSGILADSLRPARHPGDPHRERLRHRQRRASATACTASPAGMLDVVLVVGADKVRETSARGHVLGVDGP